MNRLSPKRSRVFALVLPVVIVLGAIASCRDTASTGYLCNYTGEKIQYVMEPLDTTLYAKHINDGRVEVIDYSPGSQRATLAVNTDICLIIADGINGLDSRNVFFNYLEIRKSTQTDFYTSREQIFDQFVEVENEVYEIQVRL